MKHGLRHKLGLNPGSLALLAAVTIWGSTFVITKSLLVSIGPLSIVVARFLIALAILAPFAYREGYRATLAFQPIFLTFGLTGIALRYGLQHMGMLFTSAGATALIQAGIPAVTAILAILLLQERLSTMQLAGIVLAILGTLIVTRLGVRTVHAPHPTLGNLLVLGSIVAWSIYTIQGKRLAVDYSATVSTTASISAGLLLLLPLTAVELWQIGLPTISVQGIGALLYLGVIASALTLFLWNYALRFVLASVAAPYISLIPVVGLVCAIGVGESVTWAQLSGGALAALGVWLSSKKL